MQKLPTHSIHCGQLKRRFPFEITMVYAIRGTLSSYHIGQFFILSNDGKLQGRVSIHALAHAHKSPTFNRQYFLNKEI